MRMETRADRSSSASPNPGSEAGATIDQREKTKAMIFAEQVDCARLPNGVMTAAAEKSRDEALVAAERANKLEEQIDDLQATKSKRGLVITLGDVLFDFNKSELRSGVWDTFDKLAAFLAEHTTRHALIEGFSDCTGAAEYHQRMYHQRMSERRANVVHNALTARGVDYRRLLTRGYGAAFPVAGNQTAEDRQRNRRVEVIISDEDGRIIERTH